VVVNMTMYKPLLSRPLGPEDIDGLVSACEQALIAIGLKDRNDPMTQLVAKKVFEIRQTGVREPANICTLAVEQLA
jgi:hypothetical protein